MYFNFDFYSLAQKLSFTEKEETLHKTKCLYPLLLK